MLSHHSKSRKWDCSLHRCWYITHINQEVHKEVQVLQSYWSIERRNLSGMNTFNKTTVKALAGGTVLTDCHLLYKERRERFYRRTCQSQWLRAMGTASHVHRDGIFNIRVFTSSSSKAASYFGLLGDIFVSTFLNFKTEHLGGGRTGGGACQQFAGYLKITEERWRLHLSYKLIMKITNIHHFWLTDENTDEHKHTSRLRGNKNSPLQASCGLLAEACGTHVVVQYWRA